jgi:CheY-like chemotaxis protein
MAEETQKVLLIEDNHDDVFLMRRAVKKAGMPWNVNVVMDGQEALDYMNGAGKFANREQFPLPSLVFLDLKLPYFSGFDVLTRIRSHETLKDVPVIVLTSSPEHRDQQKAAELGANVYLIKPPTEDMLRRIAATN